MANAKKLPSGNWRVLEYSHTDIIDGKKIRRYVSFTDPDKNEAEYQASKFRRNKNKLTNKSSIALTKAIDLYILNKSNLLSPETIRGYRIMQRNAFPDIIDIELKKIAENNLAQDQINKSALKYSQKSVRNQHGLLTAVFNFNKISLEKITLKPPEEKIIPVPTKKEAEKIMMLLQTAPDIECQALLALTCSLRQSEIAALKVENVKGNIIQIRGAQVRDENNKLVYKKTNKTLASKRDVAMPGYLAEKVNARCEAVKEGALFDITHHKVLYWFKKLLVDNGMPPYTIHSLRHCFAAMMHYQNIPDKYVMKMGGWSSDHVLKKVYQYAFDEETITAKNKANTYFDDVMRHEMQHDNKKD